MKKVTIKTPKELIEEKKEKEIQSLQEPFEKYIRYLDMMMYIRLDCKNPENKIDIPIPKKDFQYMSNFQLDVLFKKLKDEYHKKGWDLTIELEEKHPYSKEEGDKRYWFDFIPKKEFL